MKDNISYDKKRILIVDDMPHWRRLLSTLLAEYELETIDSYANAVLVIKNSKFDVAILDIRLDDENSFNVDGVDLLKKLRIQQPNIGIIILTGYRESVRDKVLREYKPNEILNKESFDNNEFREIVHKLMWNI